MKYHEDQYIKLFGENQIYKNQSSENPFDKYKESYINIILMEKVCPNKNHSSKKLQSLSSILGEFDEATKKNIINILFKKIILDNVKFFNNNDFDTYVQMFNNYVCKVKAIKEGSTLKCKTDEELKSQCRYQNGEIMLQIEILSSELLMELTKLKKNNNKLLEILKY